MQQKSHQMTTVQLSKNHSNQLFFVNSNPNKCWTTRVSSCKEQSNLIVITMNVVVPFHMRKTTHSSLMSLRLQMGELRES